MSLRAFGQMRVSTISPERSIAEACWLIRDNNLSCLVVESNNKTCGIPADSDIATKLAGEQRDPLTTMVEEVMISEITSRTSRSTEMRAGSRVHTHHVRRIPIMDTLETVLGIVTMDDLITLLRNEISKMENVVRERQRMSRHTAHPSSRSDHLRKSRARTGVRWR